MEPIANTIVNGAERMLKLADALLKDVTPERFARFAAPGGQTIHANHAAFVYGHLALYPQRILAAAGEDPAPAASPEAWTPLFQHGAECKDDPEGTIYPAMDEIVSVFRESHRVAIDRVKAWPDSTLARNHGLQGPMAEAFPTVGQVANFLLLGHSMMHLGQMSTWRRAEGLGSAM